MFDSVRYRMYAAVDDAVIPSGLLARIILEKRDGDIAYRVDVLEPFDLRVVEDASLVLLRCLHVLIPESQGDLSLRRHADPVFHKTSQTGPVPFALIPDEAPLCTTRSKNVRHVAHAVKSRVRTIMLNS